jgi:hypothetical protein
VKKRIIWKNGGLGRVQQLDLSVGREGSETARLGPAVVHFAIQVVESVHERVALVEGPGGERVIHEIDDARLARAGEVVGGDDLGGDGVHIACLIGREELPRGREEGGTIARVGEARAQLVRMSGEPRGRNGTTGGREESPAVQRVIEHGGLKYAHHYY